jgi:hypothetical protein
MSIYPSFGTKTNSNDLVCAQTTSIFFSIVYSVPIALRLFYPNPTLFQPGPFSLGPLRRPIAFIAITYSIVGVFVFSLPAAYPITTDNMNYASVLMSSTVGLILGYWFLSARHWFALDLRSEVGGGGSGVGMSEKMPSTMSSIGSGRGSGVGAGVGAGVGVGSGGLCGMSQPEGFDATLTGLEDSAVEYDDKDLDEIEHWLDHLERDLRTLE